MKGDFTRFTFASQKHYDAVLMQQGRVQTDADWNEQVMIAAHRNRTETLDIIGPTGAPQDIVVGGKGAFVVYCDPANANQLFINQGRYYVDGLMVESEAPVPYTSQPGAIVPPAPGAGIYLFYIDVWQRHVTSLEDPAIREVALAGADSGTRSQLVWQIRAELMAPVGGNINAITIPPSWQPSDTASTGTMDVQAGSTPLENQLYRVEIHRGGVATAASCKWSRDNGTVVAGVLTHTAPVAAQVTHNNVTVNVWRFSIDIDRAGRDNFSSFLPGQMVELSNDQFVLQRKPGVFGTITAVVGDTLSLEVPQGSAPLGSGSGTVNPLLGTTPTVRRWDNPWNPDDAVNATLVSVGQDYTTSTGRLILERDISVKFASTAGDLYRTGDYWLIPARTISGLVDWVPNVTQPAAGEEHRYAPLALVRIQANGAVANPALDVRDVREVFPTLRSLGGGGGGIVTGTGTANYVPKWQANNTSVLTTSTIADDGATVSIGGQLKVGTAASAVAINRFTSAAISGMSGSDLASTVPTSGGVRTYVEGVVNGTTGRHAKFVGAHALGDSLVSEAGSTVTVQAALTATGAASLQSTLRVGTAGAAVTITRFTSEAIQNLSSADLASTVPTAQAVKDFMNHSVPPGTVMAYASETIPAGWLECNGASLNGSQALYAALFTAIGKAFGGGNGSPTGFNLPDLRGRFVRGWSHGSSLDPDRASRFTWFAGGQTGDHVGSYQNDQHATHSHPFSASGWSNNESQNHTHLTFDMQWSWGLYTEVSLSGGGPYHTIHDLSITSTANTHTTTSNNRSHSHYINLTSQVTDPSGGSETRPRNVYLTYIIKL